jgi:effector-binding domain-containing protein
MINITTPRLEQRGEQPYVFIRSHVRMGEIEPKATSLVPQVFQWLGQHDIEPLGPVFFRYNVVDMDDVMEIDVGVILRKPVAGDARVKPGVVPAGTYATLRHTGHPDELMEATRLLLEWGDANQVRWRKRQHGKTGEAWDARFEFYLDGPDTQPDMAQWRTDLAFQVDPR